MQRVGFLLLRSQHLSVFIGFLSFGIIIGVALAVLPESEAFSGLGWSVGALILLILCAWKRSAWMLALVLLVGLIFGLARGGPLQQDLRSYNRLVGQQVEIKAKIKEDVTFGKNRDQQIKLTDVIINNETFPGTLWVSTNDKADLKRSYSVTVRGELQKGFGTFAGSMFRAELISVVDSHNDPARETRDWFADNIRSAIDEPEASLGIGFLVGQKSALPESLEESLRLVGLTHIVVASGYNLTILVRFARRIFAPISKYLAALSGGLMITGFILMTGFSPSMTRAGLVAGLSLAAWYYGRSVHPLILLPFAAAITVLINPSFVWGDLGWYLSFAAFGGVMILAPLLQHFFFGPEKPGTFRQILGETISAQIATLPIIAFSFGTIAIYSLPANLLVLPFVPIAMLLVFVSGLAAIFLPFISLTFGSLSYIVLHYMVEVVKWVEVLPNASLEISFGLAGLVASYLIVVTLCIILQISTKHSFRKDNIVE